VIYLTLSMCQLMWLSIGGPYALRIKIYVIFFLELSQIICPLYNINTTFIIIFH